MFSYTLKKNWILGPRNGEFGNNGNFVGVFFNTLPWVFIFLLEDSRKNSKHIYFPQVHILRSNLFKTWTIFFYGTLEAYW